MPPPTTRRADAERNRDKILAAARTAFDDAPANVSMAEISRRAGVGMATLYRNFPSRQALLEALYLDNVKELARSAEDLAGFPPWDALTVWLLRFAAYFASKQALASELLDYSDESAPVFTDSRRAVFAAAQPLLERAQRSGDVRPDVTVDHVMDMVVGIARIPESAPGHIDRILGIALDGLRSR